MPRVLVSAVLLGFCASVAIAAPTKRDEAEKSVDAADKIICKRFVETGSLVKAQRVCKPKRDWERERDALRMIDTRAACGTAGTTGAC